MRKAEKYIYIVLGIILVVVIACGITYVIVTNNNETNEETPSIEDGITLKDTY